MEGRRNWVIYLGFIEVESLQMIKGKIKVNTEVYDRRLINKIAQLPLVIVQSFTENPFKTLTISNKKDFNKKDLSPSQPPGIHLVILVHGFQGTSYDMKTIKNHLSRLYP